MVPNSPEADGRSKNVRNGTVAEWLGRGLQNLLQQFESARYLRKKSLLKTQEAFCVPGTPKKTSMLEIIQITNKSTPEELEQVKQLFREYAAWLSVDLSFQRFEEEMLALPENYSAPVGALFMAKVDGQPAGCVAVRRFDNTTCEMKRLFVRDAYKGHGVGKTLAAKAIEAGKELGYQRMLLDTLAHMRPAIELYTALGFQPIAAYYDNPISNAVYLSMMLEEDSL